MFKADLTQTEVEAPITKWCACGHTAPEFYRRSGPDSPQEPIRFFHVIGKNINGIYCEPCLVIAHHVAKIKKQ